MEKAGEGIANQRKAIALGIKDSLETIQETGVGNDEANQLFMFTQWTEMMNEFAKSGKSATVVLPSDYKQASSMFEQMLCASEATRQEAFRRWTRSSSAYHRAITYPFCTRRMDPRPARVFLCIRTQDPRCPPDKRGDLQSIASSRPHNDG